MAKSIEHRGPDSEGYYTSRDNQLSIGMRRLAIIDIESGQQPFSSYDKKVHLVFNGEIYNFQELKWELLKLGVSFKTRSDTEVILQGFLKWGQRCWARLQGMFTIAIIDERENKSKLILVRDRVGIKPLYYLLRGNRISFASEIKALLSDKSYSPDINIQSLKHYLSLRYVPGPDTLFKEIRKFPPATVGVWCNGKFKLESWWKAPSPSEGKLTGSLKTSSSDLGKALTKSVERHMISDVPVGLFLSGGVDSNILLALMTEFANEPIKTFSIGFPENKNSDSSAALIAAKFFGTDHHSLICTSDDMLNLGDIAYSLDEPIGDPIIVAMSKLSDEASKHVKVVLSGEGADELMGGYMFHKKLQNMAIIKTLLPKRSFQYLSKIIQALPQPLLEMLFDYPGVLGKEGRNKLASMIKNMGTYSLSQMYINSISLFDPDHIKSSLKDNVFRKSSTTLGNREYQDNEKHTSLQTLINLQYSNWLPDDILMKCDKISMAHSLEVRVPFLDEMVIDAAVRVRDNHKNGLFKNKIALRKFAEAKIPSQISNAPKRAFYVPLEAYLQDGVMRDLFNWALDPERIKRRGLFDINWIQTERSKGRSSGFLPNKRLFSIVMLEIWLDKFVPDISWN